VVLNVIDVLEQTVRILVFPSTVVVLVAVPERTVAVRGFGGLDIGVKMGKSHTHVNIGRSSHSGSGKCTNG
jgi:hypothetical protein